MSEITNVEEVEALLKRLEELTTSQVREMLDSEADLWIMVRRVLDSLARIGIELFQKKLLPTSESAMHGPCVTLEDGRTVLTDEGKLARYGTAPAIPSEYLERSVLSLQERVDRGTALIVEISEIYSSAYSRISERKAAARDRREVFKQVVRLLKTVG